MIHSTYFRPPGELPPAKGFKMFRIGLKSPADCPFTIMFMGEPPPCRLIGDPPRAALFLLDGDRLLMEFPPRFKLATIFPDALPTRGKLPESAVIARLMPPYAFFGDRPDSTPSLSVAAPIQ